MHFYVVSGDPRLKKTRKNAGTRRADREHESAEHRTRRSPPSPRPTVTAGCSTLEWWRDQDSNLGRLSQQIYSLSPLAARESRQPVILRATGANAWVRVPASDPVGYRRFGGLRANAPKSSSDRFVFPVSTHPARRHNTVGPDLTRKGGAEP